MRKIELHVAPMNYPLTLYGYPTESFVSDKKTTHFEDNNTGYGEHAWQQFIIFNWVLIC